MAAARLDIRLFAFAWMFTFACFTPAAAQPRPDVPAPHFDFGRVAQGTPVAHAFALRNQGTEPLIIENLLLTPPLFVAKFPARIAPGGAVELAVTMATSAMTGPYEGTIRVVFRNVRQPDAVMTVRGTVIPAVDFLPRGAFFVVNQRGGTATAAIEVVNRAPTPLTITSVDHLQDRFTTHLDVLEPGQRYRLRLTMKPDAALGYRDDAIVLRTDSALLPTLRVIAHTRVRERVYTFPDSVDMGRLPPSTDAAALISATQTLMVYSVGSRNLQAAFSTDVSHLDISAERGPNGDRWQATVRYKPAAVLPPAFTGTITITTNDHQFPVLTVPVSGGTQEQF